MDRIRTCLGPGLLTPGVITSPVSQFSKPSFPIQKNFLSPPSFLLFSSLPLPFILPLRPALRPLHFTPSTFILGHSILLKNRMPKHTCEGSYFPSLASQARHVGLLPYWSWVWGVTHDASKTQLTFIFAKPILKLDWFQVQLDFYKAMQCLIYQ
jgi:hypothetical protein